VNFAQYGADIADNTKPSYSTDQAAEQITRTGSSWNGFGVTGTPATITYAFRATAPGTMPLDMGGFSQLTAAQMAAAELALQSWSDVANITFVRVNPGGYSNDAQMLFGNYSSGTQGAAAFGFSPTNPDPNKAGDVWLKSTYGFNLNPVLLGYGRHLIVHEIGHALGFAHPGSYDVTNGSPTYAADAVYKEDTLQYSVMSYWSETNTGADFQGFYASAPLLHDIAAAQRLYGANMNTRTGDTVYGFNSNAGRDYFSATSASNELIFAVWDAGGTDTLNFSLYADAQLINLNAETFSNVGVMVGNVSIARGVVIENAIGGSGSDTIVGNSANNALTGGGGADTLTGWAGADVLYGGDGNDILSADRPIGFDGGTDVDQIYGGAGNDMIFAGYGDTVDGGAGFDTLNLAYIGAPHGITGDTKVLFAGQPLYPGGGTVQNIERFDAIALTQFNDTMVVGDQADPATAYGYDGDDHLIGQENRVVLYGGNGNDLLVGSTANDVLYGENGNDKIIGHHGPDELWGGAGSDTFYFTSTDATDRIMDFEVGSDKIDVSGIDANTSASGVQSFSFIGAASFSGQAGQLRVYQDGGQFFVAGDVNGDGVADLLINLGSVQVGSGDFIFV
jgi:serralysin